jgi:hypothetical protein
VRLDAPEVLAGSAPPGLHLVRDEQDPVFVEDLLHRTEQSIGRCAEATDALDRLDDHAGDVAGGRRVDHIAKIATARVDVLGVVEILERAAVAVRAVHVTDHQWR